MSLFTNPAVAQLAVDGTLWSLAAFSVVTWTLILVKGIQSWRIRNQNRQYKKAFWAATDLNAAALLHQEGYDGPVARVAQVGFSVLKEAENQSVHDLQHTGDRQELLERYLRQQIHKERRAQESGLAILASIGSTAPFVGLFGTVWGILHALVDIGRTGSASLEVVAGPIGEALIATGLGIGVAVPAVLAYNFFVRRLKISAAYLDDFATDYIKITRKAAFRLKVVESNVVGGKKSKDAEASNISETSQGVYA